MPSLIWEGFATKISYGRDHRSLDEYSYSSGVMISFKFLEFDLGAFFAILSPVQLKKNR